MVSDAVVSILGDTYVEGELADVKSAGIPIFTVDHQPSPHAVNNTITDNYQMGIAIGRLMTEAMGGQGRVAVFNAFEKVVRACGIRTQM